MADVAGDTIGHNRAVDVGLVGDVGIIARQLAASLKGLPVREPMAWLDRLRSIESAKRAKLDSEAGAGLRPVNAPRLGGGGDRCMIGEGTVEGSGGKDPRGRAV